MLRSVSVDMLRMTSRALFAAARRAMRGGGVMNSPSLTSSVSLISSSPSESSSWRNSLSLADEIGVEGARLVLRFLGGGVVKGDSSVGTSSCCLY